MLDATDLTQSLDRETYKLQLARRQLEMRALAFRLYQEKRSLVIVYEGWDAAGKGGNIKRVTARLDPRGYKAFSIGAPTGDDATHHYLWRFWRRLVTPEEKQILIFDRSWYGRVLVERVEGFAEEHEWRRAYREINDFERELTDTGMILVKFWIHISPEEQLRRFKDRKTTRWKTWKLTDEDWRNRDRWEAYAEAVEEMIQRTSIPSSRWHVIAGNDKLHARVATLTVLVDTLAEALGD